MLYQQTLTFSAITFSSQLIQLNLKKYRVSCIGQLSLFHLSRPKNALLSNATFADRDRPLGRIEQLQLLYSAINRSYRGLPFNRSNTNHRSSSRVTKIGLRMKDADSRICKAPSSSPNTRHAIANFISH